MGRHDEESVSDLYRCDSACVEAPGSCGCRPPLREVKTGGGLSGLRPRPAAHLRQQLRGRPGIRRQTVLDLHRLDGGAARLSQHAVDLADVVAGADKQPLQFLDVVERQLRNRAGGLAHRRCAGDAGREIARRGRIDQRVIPLGIGGEIGVGQERRPHPAHRQQQRGRQIVVRQRLAVGIGDAELRHLRARQLDGEVGLVPREIRGRAHLFQPRLAAPPFQPGCDIIRGRADHIGRTAQHVAAAVAVIVDGVGEVMRRQELRLAELAGPRADHLARRQVAAIDDLQRGDGLVLETLAAAAVIGERHQRRQHRQVAHVGAEVALQSPERGDHGGRHAIFLLGARERRLILLDVRLAALHAVGRRHAPRELGKDLSEHALAAVAVDDALVVGEVGRGFRYRALRDALRDRLLLEIGEEALETRAVVAGGAAARGGGGNWRTWRARRFWRGGRPGRSRSSHRRKRLLRGHRSRKRDRRREGCRHKSCLDHDAHREGGRLNYQEIDKLQSNALSRVLRDRP